MQNTKKKLAIISTHPIQYYAPFFKMLTERGQVQLKVFYTWSQARERVQDDGFKREIRWDIPLLEGYSYEFVENTSKKPGNKSFYGIQNPDLISCIKQYSPDALLVYGWNFESHLMAMRHFKRKIPVWFRGDSTLLDETGGLRSFARRFFLRWIYTHVDRAFFVGTNNKQYFAVHGLKEDQLCYAPHAVDNQRFLDSKYEADAMQWRRELGYDPDDIVILFAGKLEPKKNPTLLIRLFNNYFRDSGKLKLLIAGNGVQEQELTNLAKGNPNIQFLPFQNQSRMPSLYRVGDVYCLPSQGPGETWGLALNESLACGRAVIGSAKVGGAVDLIANDTTGWMLQDTASVEELANIIKNIKPSDVKNEVNKTYRQKFIQHWSYESICQAIEESFNSKAKVKLSYFLSHPVQYFSPLLKELNQVFDLKVYYFSGTDQGKFDEGFGMEIKWDVPLLEGYAYHFIKNYSPIRSINNRFFDLIDPGIFQCLKNDQSSIVVVHGWSYFSSIFTIVIARLLRKEVWVRAENPLNQELRKSKGNRILKKVVLQFILFPWINKFLYIGQRSKEFFQYYGVKEHQLIFTPYAVDNNYFRDKYTQLKPAKHELLSELGLPDGKHIILFTGKYIEKKRPLDLLRAFQLMDRNDIVLVMVGEGTLRKTMEEFILYEQVPNVFLTGFKNQSEIVKYYSVADIFVMCSGMGETWGLSVNEAMNFSLPIVITETCGSSYDLVENGLNGFVVKEGDIVDLKNKILAVIDSVELRRTAGEASWTKVQNYSIPEIVRRLSNR